MTPLWGAQKHAGCRRPTEEHCVDGDTLVARVPGHTYRSKFKAGISSHLSFPPLLI